MDTLRRINYEAIYGRGEALWAIQLHKLYLGQGYNNFDSFVKEKYPDLKGLD